jgi:hypothetical protein
MIIWDDGTLLSVAPAAKGAGLVNEQDMHYFQLPLAALTSVSGQVGWKPEFGLFQVFKEGNTVWMEIPTGKVYQYYMKKL